MTNQELIQMMQAYASFTGNIAKVQCVTLMMADDNVIVDEAISWEKKPATHIETVEMAGDALEQYLHVVHYTRAFEALRDSIRRDLEAFVERHGNIDIAQLGQVKSVPMSISHTYNKKEVDELMILLAKDARTNPDLNKYLDILNVARQESIRKKSVRIVEARGE